MKVHPTAFSRTMHAEFIVARCACAAITGSVALIWSLTFIVGLGRFAHCIAGSGEILAAVLCHKLALLAYVKWLALAVAGNVTGWVVLVTLLEYGQAKLD
jgi:formate-nitrite transporter family protein